MVKGEYVLLVPSILGISKKENSPGKKSHLLTLLKKIKKTTYPMEEEDHLP